MSEDASETNPTVPAVETTAPTEGADIGILNPVTKKIVEKCIMEVLTEYAKETRQFTADSLHYIRMKVTDLAKQRLGDDEVTSIDVGLDLTTVENIPFFFKINIPQDKAESHIIKQEKKS